MRIISEKILVIFCKAFKTSQLNPEIAPVLVFWGQNPKGHRRDIKVCSMSKCDILFKE